MDVRVLNLVIFVISPIFIVKIDSFENKVKFVYQADDLSFKEELVITNVTCDEELELDHDIFKWKSMTLNDRNYAVGISETGICLLNDLREEVFSVCKNITESPIKILDAELHKIWNPKLLKFNLALLILIEGGSLNWFGINDELEMNRLSTLELDKEAFLFNIYTIDNIDYLFVLNQPNEFNITTLNIYKSSVTTGKYAYLWPEQTIVVDSPSSSFTLNNQNQDYYLSITHKLEKEVKIYKRIHNIFKLSYVIENTDSNTLHSFSIGPKSYLLTTGENSAIYKLTRSGPIKESLIEKNITSWLPIPLQTYKEEIYLLAQKEVYYDDHISHSIEMIHSNGFNFSVYHEVSCNFFGQSLNGLDCLVEEEEHLVELDNSALLPFDKFIGVIISRKNHQAHFVKINFNVEKVVNPQEIRIKHLKELKNKIEKMQEKVKELKKHKEIKKKEALILQSSSPQAAFGKKEIKEFKNKQRKSNSEILDEFAKRAEGLKESVKELRDFVKIQDDGTIKIKNLVINGDVEVKGVGKFDKVEAENLNNEEALEVLKDIVGLNNPKIITSKKIFNNLKTENIDFEFLNGIERDRLIFNNTKSSIILNGNVEFKNGLEIAENLTTQQLNGVTFEDEVIDVTQNQELIQIDSVVIDNLKVGKINSKSLKEIVEEFIGNSSFESLELTNLTVLNVNNESFSEVLSNMVLDNLEIDFLEIDCLNTSNLQISYLNDLKFPDDYVLDDAENVNITGFKKFVTKPTINSLKITDLINEIKTSDIFRLSTKKNLTDGKFDILKPGDFIDDLEIDGDLIIEENLGDVNLNDYLNNFFWKNSNNTTINSTKIFENLQTENLNVEIINNLPSTLIVNKSNNQTININTLENVTIENLELDGKINDINITHLLKNAIMLNKNQNISSSLTFNELNVTNLVVLNSLNNLPLQDFLFTNGEKHLKIDKLNNINVTNFIVKETNGIINNFDVEDLQKRALRKNGPQEIFGDIYVDELNINYLNATKINNLYSYELFNSTYFETKIKKIISDGKLSYKNFSISGNFTLNKLNNIKIEDMMNSLAFTNENNLQPNITFRDNVKFNNITVKAINGIPFNNIQNDAIFKNETKIKLGGDKTFKNGFEVKKFIETNTLNGINLENVLRNESDQSIHGSVIIKGNVSIENDLNLEEINEVLTQDFKIFNISNDFIHINNDVLFNKSAHIKTLNLHGLFNENNLTDVFHNLINLNDDVNYQGMITFKEKVNFEQNLDVSDTFNDFNLKNLDDIVYINEDDFIEGLVSFKNNVKVNGTISVESDLLTKTIMGINPHDWWKNGVFINKNISGELKFENVTVQNFIRTGLLNNMNTSRFVTLLTDQKIDEEMVIENLILEGNLNVKGLVNGVDLEKEFSNTVLSKGVQNISSKITFNDNVLIYKDLQIKGNSKNIDFNNIFFINEDGILKGNLNFSSKVKAKNLEIRGLINGINFTEWYENSLKKNSNRIQNLSESMSFKNLIVEDYSYGKGLINGLDFRNVTNYVGYNLEYKKKIEKDFKIDYSASCKDINHLKQISQSQIYRFKYLERIATVEVEKPINFLSYFVHKDERYLIVNEKNSCNSTIFQWNYQTFSENVVFKTGTLQQLITVKSENKIHLIGISTNCYMPKTNLWVFEQNLINNHQSLDQVNLLQESLIPNTFYGITQNEVREYKINEKSDIFVYRKWKINGNDNMVFIPNGLKTGLALRDGQKLIKLERNDDEMIEFGIDVQETILGRTEIVKNRFIPGKNGEIVVFNVGGNKKVMVAVSNREGSSIKTKSDSIKIYSNIFKGTLFQKIPTYKPSSITVLDLQNGETLLMFFEDQKIFHVYAYKGIEGFQHIKSAKLGGQGIIKMQLTTGNSFEMINSLAILNNNEVIVMKIVMDGNQNVNVDDMFCEL
ncbi:uncharacterized protein PF3D7_1120600 [Onthophagus taurus]|uniref:uncharacterized protein PF3D7_1120600 n=1 Tax=Onthophagus taurus TaxID=166361 RepID=UPI0039BE52E3